MTDKVQKIKEFLIGMAGAACCEPNTKKHIEKIILPLQEEPAPKVFEDMLNAKTAAESLGISPEEHDKIVDECLYGKEPELVDFDDLPKEEPVSEDLEKSAKEYVVKEAAKDINGNWTTNDILNSFKAGAKWQKLEDMGITNNAKNMVRNVLNSSDEPLDTYATEVAFMMLPANLTENYHMKNRSRISDAVRLGAKWQKEQMMAKGVDVEVKVDAGGYPYIPQMELYDYDKDVPLAKEGKKVKVIVIKED